MRQRASTVVMQPFNDAALHDPTCFVAAKRVMTFVREFPIFGDTVTLEWSTYQSMADQTPLTVSAITQKIKQSLELEYPSLAVVGELSNFKQHSSGHLYFTLKDEYAQIAGVMWRSRVSGLKFKPQDGMKVIVTGRITVYEVRGVYQIDATAIRPLGAGDLQLAFEELKRRLAAEGLFDESRKKPLPEYPGRIGIITSPTGAVLHDMLHVFRRRFPFLTLIFRPAAVQGPGAADDIVAALADLNAYNDVELIILARGGGSLEDLWPFNEERVARAIARSRLPVVSAVGHEVDYTIADFVADLRAPTPTAAAELVVRDRKAIIEILKNSRYTMAQSLASRISMNRKHIQHLLKSYAFHRPIDLLRQHTQHIDELARVMSTTLAHRFALTTAQLKGVDERLQALNPVLVLKRGYAVVRKDGSIVGSSARLHARDNVEIQFADGTVQSTITDV